MHYIPIIILSSIISDIFYCNAVFIGDWSTTKGHVAGAATIIWRNMHPRDSIAMKVHITQTAADTNPAHVHATWEGTGARCHYGFNPATQLIDHWTANSIPCDNVEQTRTHEAYSNFVDACTTNRIDTLPAPAHVGYNDYLDVKSSNIAPIEYNNSYSSNLYVFVLLTLIFVLFAVIICVCVFSFIFCLFGGYFVSNRAKKNYLELNEV
eukprot:286222_1